MPFTTCQSMLLLGKALEQMTAALEILDDVDAPGEIGATLDHAIARLRQTLGRDEAGANGFQALFSKLEDELSRTDGERGATPDPWEIPPV